MPDQKPEYGTPEYWNEVETFQLTRGEKTSIGAVIAAWMEDFEREIKKRSKQGHDTSLMTKHLREVEETAYSKIMPEAWHGPRPDYWKKGTA